MEAKEAECADVTTDDNQDDKKENKEIDMSSLPPCEEENSIVDTPGPNDVICGRGGGSNNHTGNVYWRILVKKSKPLYICSLKRQKMVVAQSVVSCIRNRDPPGNFLEKDPVSSKWKEIGQKRAVEKTSQALRESAPIIRQAMGINIEMNRIYAEEIDNWRFECNRYSDEFEKYMRKMKTGIMIDERTGKTDEKMLNLVSGNDNFFPPTPPVFPPDMSDAAKRICVTNGLMPSSYPSTFSFPLPQAFGMSECPMPPMMPPMMPTFPMQSPFPPPVPSFYSVQNQTPLVEPFCPWLPDMKKQNKKVSNTYNPFGPVGQFPSPPIYRKGRKNRKTSSMKNVGTHDVPTSQTADSAESTNKSLEELIDKLEPKKADSLNMTVKGTTKETFMIERKIKFLTNDKKIQGGKRDREPKDSSMDNDAENKECGNDETSKKRNLKSPNADSERMTTLVREVTNDNSSLIRLESKARNVDKDFASSNPFTCNDRSKSHQRSKQKATQKHKKYLHFETDSDVSTYMKKKSTNDSGGVHFEKASSPLMKIAKVTPLTSLKRQVSDEVGMTLKQRFSIQNDFKKRKCDKHETRKNNDGVHVEKVLSSDFEPMVQRNQQIYAKSLQIASMPVKDPTQIYNCDVSEGENYLEKTPHGVTIDNDFVNQTWMELIRHPTSSFENTVSAQLMKAIQEEQQSRRREIYGKKRPMSSENYLNCTVAQGKGFAFTPEDLLHENVVALSRLENINTVRSSETPTFYNESFINEERKKLLSLSKSLNGSKHTRYPHTKSGDQDTSSRTPDFRYKFSASVPKRPSENEAFQMLVDAAEQRMINSVYPDDVKS